MTEVTLCEPGLSRRRMIMGGSLVAVSTIALARAPKVVAAPLPLEALQAMVPEELGNWRFETTSGLVVPAADPLVDELYNEVLTRIYSAPGQSPIMLLIAYSNRQDGMLQLHRPEVCYPASGLQIIAANEASLMVSPGREIPVRALTAEGRSRTEQIMYWTRVGNRYPRAWLEQRIAVALDNLAGFIPDGVLVRLSTLDPSWKRAEPSFRDFGQSLARSLDPRAKRLIIG